MSVLPTPDRRPTTDNREAETHVYIYVVARNNPFFDPFPDRKRRMRDRILGEYVLAPTDRR